ncbi:hypothetical protein [Plebeiibacterium marinum]|uniref:Uncharacterized protein n=1 Tax=Plebeiibacterium marinum TaxID=2992111 RepID=A0AAE3MA67_9BACT|nr:hypothetical protein [Plebeiobacterium marinum]MCW3804126.1 hypothetical protein [Plebeiobacterium marinum]
MKNKLGKTELWSELKRVLLFSLPFFVLLLLYVIMDPFMVLYEYKDFNKNTYIHKNLDFISTKKYMVNADSLSYDSFIFGGSTALYISPKTWREYLGKEDEPYSFIASGEHINGIWSKIKYIHRSGADIKNTIIVLDTEGSFHEFINDNPIFMKHYKVFPSSALMFHYLTFTQFVNVRFLRALVHYELSGNFHDYMGTYLVWKECYYDNISNEYYNVGILEEIRNDSIGYYKRRPGSFVRNRLEKEHYISPQLNEEYVQKLKEIKRIFDEHRTEYKIIIGPNYYQKVFNKSDLVKIRAVFGDDNVFDFSGQNHFSKEKSNFYDNVHFKKYVGDQLIDIVYSQNKDDK